MSRIEKDSGLLLEGDVYFKAEGTSEFVDLGNFTDLSIVSEGSEFIERESHQRDTSGNSLDTVQKKGKAAMSFTFDTFKKLNLAMAVMGVSSDTSQSSTAVVDKNIVITELNRFVELGVRGVDETTVVVKDTSNAVVDASLVSINPRLGFVMVKSGGTVNKGDTVKVSFSTLDKEGYLIKAGAASSYKGEIRVDAKNLATGKDFEVCAGRVTFAADGGINWTDAKSFTAATMKGTAAIMPAEKVPYIIYGEYANES